MDDMNYSSDVEYEIDTKKEKKGFKITRGMALLFIALIIVVIVIIIIAISGKKKTNAITYTINDFTNLEKRMVIEASNYVAQNKIQLTAEEQRINLSNLLLDNGGAIDSNKLPAAKICTGYVLASKTDTEKYDAFIKCESGNTKYTTTGYVSNDKITTTTKTAIKDTVAPVITLIGSENMQVDKNSRFVDPYVTAIDDVDGDITSKVNTTGSVNTSKVGTYELVYTVHDKARNKATKIRKVVVVEQTTTTTIKTQRIVTTTKRVSNTTTVKTVNPPKISLNGAQSVTIPVGSTYKDAGYYAVDGSGNNITSKVKVSGNVNTSKAGVYSLTFSVTDAYGNSATAVRRVTVKDSTIKLKSISITPANITLKKGTKEKYTIMYNPSNAPHENITWSIVSGVGIVTIDSNGVVTAKKVGTATIKATTTSGISATTTISVH